MSIYEYDEELHNKTLYEEGYDEGKRESQLAIARSLLGILDSATIADKTGLTIDEVRELQKV